MGYTHYWTHRRRFTNTEWKCVKEDLQRIADVSGVPLEDLFCGEDFLINGVGEDAHETFCVYQNRRPLEEWQRPDQKGWDFCKTARKPYDAVVTAMLCYLESIWPQNFEVGSDGMAEDWTSGLALAKAALPELAERITIPWEVQHDDYMS